MPLSAIPVVMFGVNVGSAVIYDDGTIDLTMGSPCALGKDLMARLQSGQFAALNIMPAGIDMPPMPGLIETVVTDTVNNTLAVGKKSKST